MDWDTSPLYYVYFDEEVDAVDMRDINPTLLGRECIPKYNMCNVFNGYPKSENYSLKVQP